MVHRSTKGAHAFMAENISGTIYYYDPQKAIFGTETYFDFIDGPRPTKFIKVNGATMNEKAKKCYKEVE